MEIGEYQSLQLELSSSPMTPLGIISEIEIQFNNVLI